MHDYTDEKSLHFVALPKWIITSCFSTDLMSHRTPLSLAFNQISTRLASRDIDFFLLPLNESMELTVIKYHFFSETAG